MATTSFLASKGEIPYAPGLALDAYVQRGRRLALPSSSFMAADGRPAAGSAHVGQILELLTRAGYNWFSVDYRLGGPDAITRTRSLTSAPRSPSSGAAPRSSDRSEPAGAARRGLRRAAGRVAGG